VMRPASSAIHTASCVWLKSARNSCGMFYEVDRSGSKTRGREAARRMQW
jgi:hypothetical protein